MEKAGDNVPALESALAKLKQASSQLAKKVEESDKAKAEVQQVKTEMAECCIPVNIQVRRNELKALSQKIESMKKEFRDMQIANKNSGDKSDSQDIKELIAKIDKVLQENDKEASDLERYQTRRLEKYTKPDFQSYDNQPIIIEVREFKEKIQILVEKLKDLEALLNDLNTKLILKDMDNAIVLISKKAVSLRERLLAAQETLKRIQDCGDEMDGNTTVTEEDEFIETLKAEMPDVFKNVDLNFE